MEFEFHCSTPCGNFPPSQYGATRVSVSNYDQLVEVALVRIGGAQALGGSYIVDVLPAMAYFSASGHLVAHSHR